MKKTLSILFCVCLLAGLSNITEAQRGHGGGGSSRSSGGGGGFSSYRGGGSAQPHAFQSAPRSYSNLSRNNTFGTQRFQPSQRFNSNVSSMPQRNAVVRNNSYSFNQSRQSGVQSGRFPRPINSPYNRGGSNQMGRSYRSYTVNNFHYSNHYYGGGYYTYNHRMYSFMYGPRYTFIPRNSLYINFGGFPYYYNAGLFYGYYGGFYQPLFPPFGLRISVLPYGYYPFYLNGYPYYYYNGIYYQQYDNQYEVVDAPMGATVNSLPEGVKPVVINGEKLYELNGTYYKEGVNSKGKTIYTVVGKNGQVNNTDNIDENNNDTNNNLNNDNGYVAPQNNNNNIDPQPQTDNGINNDQSTSLQVGDMVNQLPAGSKTVSINGSTMYVTPDNVYLQEDNNNGNATYKVVGK